MRTQKYLFVLLFSLIISAGSLFAQGLNDSHGEPVSINVKRGLTLSKIAGDLIFDDVLVGTAVTPTKTPEQGVKFKVEGHNTGNVTVSFADATLVDAAGNNLTFEPSVESTGNSSTYVPGTPLNTGDTPAMTDDGSGTGLGELYLWVGGQIDVLATTPQGDYAGTFTLTVAY